MGDVLAMPNYLYHCKKCDTEFREFISVDERDEVQCPACHEHADRIFEGTTAFKTAHLSTAEKGIKADLLEANRLERIAAYDGGARNAEDQKRINREVEKLKFTD